MPFRTRRFTAWIAAASVAATLAIALIDELRFSYESVDMHVMISTAVTLIGVLAAGLVLARFLRSGLLQDLALTAALAIFSGSNLFFSVLPAAVGEFESNFVAWAPFIGGVVGAVVFALSVAIPESVVLRPRRAAWLMIGAVLLVVGLIAAITGWLAPGWPDPMKDMVLPGDSNSPHLTSDVAQLVLVALTLAVYVIAAVGFVGRAERTGDELIGWFALAAPFGAAASLNYFLFPSLYPAWVYTGDILRVGFYTMVAVGAAREIAAWQEQLVEAAASGERRRIARDLHDGLAQELAFIVGQARSLVQQTGSDGPFSHIAAAAERALDESRTAIAALSRNADDPLDAALAQAAEDVAGRTGTKIRFDLAPNVHVAPDVREDLVRIVREAVSNAARHGEAENVTVTLLNTDSVCVRVTDDGKGFDPDEPRRRGFGLTSMRERAESRGGTITVSSRPGEGTVVEVLVP